MTEPTKVYVDGSTTRICWWFGEGDFSVEEIDKATNNQAEYLAVTAALVEASKRGIRRIGVYSDSQLVMKQLMGHYAIRDYTLQGLARNVWQIRQTGFDAVSFEWVPREQNPAGRILG